jgi:hypothetical protein
LQDRLAGDWFGVALYSGIAGVGLLLAGIGICGVMSFAA